MGCKTCSSKKTGGAAPGGCQNNGGCETGGCNKMNVFDWLSDMSLPADANQFDVVEVRFKGGRKDFYRNTKGLDIATGDAVIVDVTSGYHLGHVSLSGELVRLQMKKRKVRPESSDINEIIRIATERDIEMFEEVVAREETTMYRAREVIREQGLDMKLSDVEYQADRSKATFYYSAEERVDFRELIRALGGEFKIRVDMRQISLRQEAGRLGGIGVCGRELCCSTWLTDFKSVSTSAARYQNLSLNPSKLSGQCGRLKCCLNYELDTYMQALKDIPNVKQPLQIEGGDAYLQKTDIFKKIMWFALRGDNNWHPVTCKRVKEILEMNKKGERPSQLSDPLFLEQKEKEIKEPDWDEVLEDDLGRMDDKFSKSSTKRRRKKKKSGKRDGQPKAQVGQQPNEKMDTAQPRPKKRSPNPRKRNPAEGGKQNEQNAGARPAPDSVARPKNKRRRPPRPKGEGGAKPSDK